MIKIPLKKLVSGHIIIELIIKDLSLNMIVDTGASGTLLSQSVAITLNLISTESEEKAIGANSMELDIAMLPPMDLYHDKTLILSDAPVLMLDMEGINTALKETDDIDVHGLIGADFLSRTQAIIDYSTETLSLRVTDDKV